MSRLTQLLVLAWLLTGALPSTASAFIRGDADNDGNVNALVDSLFILGWGFAMGAEPPCLDAADVDDDGNTNALIDGLALLNYGFVPGSPPPAAPFPLEGVDPTPDNIPPGDCGNMPPPMPGPVVELERGCCSGLPEGVYAAFDQQTFGMLWQQHVGQGGPPPPAVDFDADAVLFVVKDFFNGTHEVFITSAEIGTSGTDSQINYTTQNQVFPCAQLIVSTQPFHIVSWTNAVAAGVPTDVIGAESIVDACDPPALCNSACP